MGSDIVQKCSRWSQSGTASRMFPIAPALFPLWPLVVKCSVIKKYSPMSLVGEWSKVQGCLFISERPTEGGREGTGECPLSLESD